MNEHDKQLIHRSHDEVMAAGHLELIPEIYAENFENFSGGTPDFLRYGRSAMEKRYSFLRASFTEMEIVANTQLVEGDLVGVHWTWRAKHTGDFLGIPATGVNVEIDGIDVVRIENGYIAAAWIVQDNAGLMAQLQAAIEAGSAAQE